MKRTPLYDIHLASGAKMAPFAGYEMPLTYATGSLKEHAQVRTSAGLFDVSHMGQILVAGEGADRFWQLVTPSNFVSLAETKARYTALTNEAGGIIDDLIVTKLGATRFFAVLNAACKEKDIAHLKAHLPHGVQLEVWEERALLALQGPNAEKALGDVLNIDLTNLHYMQCQEISGLHISRLGYTGEDGFEISAPSAMANELWMKLVQHPDVLPVGLAARDSLRLEMGYPLYGHDLDETTSPIEAHLEWIISKNNDTYLGRNRCLSEMERGASRLRVGIVLDDRAIAREGAEIFDANGIAIGTLTSGGFSPTLGVAIGQGYVRRESALIGARVFVTVREKRIGAEIRAMPFVTRRTK